MLQSAYNPGSLRSRTYKASSGMELSESTDGCQPISALKTRTTRVLSDRAG